MLVLSDERVADIPVSPDTPLILSLKSDKSGELTAGVSPVPNLIVDEIVFAVVFMPCNVKEIIVDPLPSVELFGETVIWAFVSA
jgi:hypothetical protein